MTLTNEQQEFIRGEAANTPDLTELTRKCFDDDTLTGVKKEGRAVRKFLIENNIDFTTRQRTAQRPLELTEEQKLFIEHNANDESMSSFSLAQLIFPEREVRNLGREQRAVLRYIEELGPDRVAAGDSSALKGYVAPKSPTRIVQIINQATGLALDINKLNKKFQDYVEKLGINLSNSRFRKIYNNYTNRSDRNLFEHEFVRLTWDKPDLSADEVNLYLNVCKEIINLEVVSSHINKLNDMFDVTDDQQDMTVRLAEIIKAKSDEYHKCESRIENLTKKLQGERGERMKNRLKENASILSIVQEFQDEDGRRNMVRLAELKKLSVKETAEKLELMDEWIARVVGVRKQDVV